MLVRRFAAALLCVLVAGCLPVTTKTPVGTTKALGADAALYGTWKGHGTDDKDVRDAYFHFLDGKDGTLRAVVVFARGTSDDGWSVFQVRTATLGQNRYINAVETFDKDAPASDGLMDATIPILYTINGRVLTLFLMDEEKAKAAIEKGEIAGTVENNQFGDVKITAEAEALDAFLAKPEAAGLFKPFLVLKRVE